jgi:hypothetical protein
VSEKIAVQAPQFGIARDAAMELTASRHTFPQTARDALNCARTHIRRDAPEGDQTAIG